MGRRDCGGQAARCHRANAAARRGRFDPQLRDRLVTFFTVALHRDPAKRHGSLARWRRPGLRRSATWTKHPPATTRHTIDEEPATAAEARELSAARVEAGTPLVAAGLSARALSAAEDQLTVFTVGELVKIPAARVQRLRGIGLGPRNELVKRAREWRQQLQVAEQAQQPPKTGTPAPRQTRSRSASMRWRPIWSPGIPAATAPRCG